MTETSFWSFLSTWDLTQTPVLGSFIELFIELAGPYLVFDGCFMTVSCHLHHWSYCWGSGVSDWRITATWSLNWDMGPHIVQVLNHRHKYRTAVLSVLIWLIYVDLYTARLVVIYRIQFTCGLWPRILNIFLWRN